jgi:hypothetical protein
LTWPIRLIGVNGRTVTYTDAEARAVLAGYAFGQVPLTWNAPAGLPQSSNVGTPPRASNRYRWGYRSFDCVPASPHCIGVEDIVITAALDAGVSGQAVLGLEAIRPDLNEVLTRIPVTTTFWDLPAADLGEEPPAVGAVSWWVWRAWALLMGLRGVDRAITHKLLHRKRPWLFPMLDSVTTRHLGGLRAWATINCDLNQHKQEFVALEEWFAELASAQDGVQLTRLRIHDILLWAELSGNSQEMRDLGRPFMG